MALRPPWFATPRRAITTWRKTTSSSKRWASVGSTHPNSFIVRRTPPFLATWPAQSFLDVDGGEVGEPRLGRRVAPHLRGEGARIDVVHDPGPGGEVHQPLMDARQDFGPGSLIVREIVPVFVQQFHGGLVGEVDRVGRVEGIIDPGQVAGVESHA